MTKRAKILTIAGISLAGVALIAILALLTVPRSEWFRDYLRRKIIASVEDSTGGKVELEKFSFDLRTVTIDGFVIQRSEEHTSELQSHLNLVCRLLLEKKKNIQIQSCV